jgi:hypothetical protein
MRQIADKMYMYFNKESSENGEGEKDRLTQRVIGYLVVELRARNKNILVARPRERSRGKDAGSKGSRLTFTNSPSPSITYMKLAEAPRDGIKRLFPSRSLSSLLSL